MKVLSHRGFWRDPAEKNTAEAFRRSFAEGFGTETDFRDAAGRIVISHDPAAGGELALEDFLALAPAALTIAVNVKADGLAAPLTRAFGAAGLPWFAFDMSGPETLRYLAAGAPVFTRHSDVEPQPICYEEAQGVWLDAFRSDWFDRAVVEAHLGRGKQVCLVSPELHGRDPGPVWAWLGALKDNDDLMLCTDYPDRAREDLGL